MKTVFILILLNNYGGMVALPGFESGNACALAGEEAQKYQKALPFVPPIRYFCIRQVQSNG